MKKASFCRIPQHKVFPPLFTRPTHKQDNPPFCVEKRYTLITNGVYKLFSFCFDFGTGVKWKKHGGLPKTFNTLIGLCGLILLHSKVPTGLDCVWLDALC